MNISMDKNGNLIIERDSEGKVVFEPSNTDMEENVLEEVKRAVNTKLDEAFNEPGLKFTTSIGDKENTRHVVVTGKDISIEAKNIKIN